MEFVHADAKVTRVMGSLVSLKIAGWAPTTIRWMQSTPLSPGQAVRVGGLEDGGLRIDLQRGLRVVYVWVGTEQYQVGELPGEARKKTAPPQLIRALERHGFLAPGARLDPAQSFPPFIVQAAYADSRAAAIVRGFIWFDSKWRRDSDDPYQELLAIAEATELPSRALDAQEVELDAVAAEINRALEAAQKPRRIWLWETGGDTWVFVGRTPEEAEGMRRDGLDVRDPAPETF